MAEIFKYNPFTRKLDIAGDDTISGTGYTGVVANYSALPSAGSSAGQFYYVTESQGTAWLPGSLGGTYYPVGTYYSNGAEWVTGVSPWQASQADVDAGIIGDQFVSPLTLNNWTGANGGQTAIFTWKYQTNITPADPGNGFFRANNATPSLITQLYINDITSDNQMDVSALFGSIQGNWLIHIQQKNDASKFVQFTTGVPYIDNTGWWTVPVTYVQSGAGGGIVNGQNCVFAFINKNNNSTITFQTTYDNSNPARVITNATNGPFLLRRGSALDSDLVFAVQNGVGTNTFGIRADGVTFLPAGTAVVPSLRFTGSATNTGLYTPSPDNITVVITGTNRFNVTAGGAAVSGNFSITSGSATPFNITGTSFGGIVRGVTINNSSSSVNNQSGADYQVLNSAASPVTAGRMYANLTNTTVGSEDSQVVIQGLSAGVQTNFLVINKTEIVVGPQIFKVNELHVLDFDDINYKLAISSNNNTGLLSLGAATGSFTTVLIPMATASTSQNTGALRVSGGVALNGVTNIGPVISSTLGQLNVSATPGGTSAIMATFQSNANITKVYVWNTGTGVAGKGGEYDFIMANDSNSSSVRSIIQSVYSDATAGAERTNMNFQISSNGIVNTALALVGITATTANFVQIQPSATGLAPQLLVNGTDSNISFFISSKGRVTGQAITVTCNTDNLASSTGFGIQNTLNAAGDATLGHLNATASSTSNRSVIRLVQLDSVSAATVNTYLWGKGTNVTTGNAVTQFGVDTMIAGARASVFAVDDTGLQIRDVSLGLRIALTNINSTRLVVGSGFGSVMMVSSSNGWQFNTTTLSTPTGSPTILLNGTLSFQAVNTLATGLQYSWQGSKTDTSGNFILQRSLSSFVPASASTANLTYYAFNDVINQFAGSSGTITSIDINPSFTSLTGTYYGLRSRITATPPGLGTTWNIYADGTAPNLFNGTVNLQTPTVGNVLLKFTSITGGASNPVIDVQQNRVLTTDATVTTLHSFPTVTNVSYDIDVKVSATRTGGTAGAVGDRGIHRGNIRVKNVGGTLILMSSSVDNSSADQAWLISWALSGTNILLQVQGAVDNNITWLMTESRNANGGG